MIKHMNSCDLIVFCPLPPKKNGIADYLAEQLPYFCQKINVVVVIENNSTIPTNIPNGVVVLFAAQYLANQSHYLSIPHLYHVGNNPDTEYMLPILLSKPGIVVIHDLNLHYLIDLTNLSQGDKASYTKALVNQYGQMGEVIGDQLSQYGWKGQFMPHELMMNGSIINSASRIIVHSHYSADKIAAHGHENITIIPHHLSPSIREYQPKFKMAYRGQLGLPGNKTVITSMGFIAKAKQIKAVLHSLAELKKSGEEFVYVLAGQCKPHEYDVYQDIADYGLSENVIVTGFLTNDDFFKYLLASDFIINLRYPTGGESSGTLARAMGLGLACLVVNIGPFSEIPEQCAIKLDYNDSFQINLTRSIKQLVVDKNLRVKIGLNGKDWVEKTHGITTTTNQYLEIVNDEQVELSTLEHDDRITNRLGAKGFEWFAYPIHSDIQQWHENAISLNTELPLEQHWWQEATLPYGNKDELLAITPNVKYLHTLTELYQYKNENITHHSVENISWPSRKFYLRYTRALIVMPARLVEYDPVKVLAQINAHLAEGAICSLNLIWDSDINSEVSFDRTAWLTYFTAAGFKVERHINNPMNIDMFNLNQQNFTFQEWCFVVQKCSNMINRSPQPFYAGQSSTLQLITPAVCSSDTVNIHE